MKKVAFISVFHKEGIDEFASELLTLGWELMASGGTAKYLQDKGLEVRDLSDIVGEAILGHRVVSLSREFYAMLLARPGNPEDEAELARLELPFISLVCCDMYPLEEETSSASATLESVIEKTDIGGPTMIRAGAKGERIVVCDVEDRARVIDWLKAGEPEEQKFKRELAAKAEYTIAKYCLTSARYLSDGGYDGILGERSMTCGYGENAWQTPAHLYKRGIEDPLAMAHKHFNRIAGVSMSYNNLADLDRLLQTVTHIAGGFDKNNLDVPYIAIGVKHGNPCGAAVGANPVEVIQAMLEGDMRAIFGGLIITNFEIKEKEAEALLHHGMPEGRKRLLDGIFASGFSDQALEQLKRKGDKCRLLVNEALGDLSAESLDQLPRFRNVRGGFLLQPNYTFVPDFSKAQVEGDPDILDKKSMLADLILAWAVGSTSNSNTITIVKDGKLVGNGVGQQDRVGAAKLAIMRADDAAHSLPEPRTQADLAGAVAYSDSFFPFPDAPLVLLDRGVQVIFTTSGSVKDGLVTEEVNKKGGTLVMMPDKEARGFAWH